MAEFLSNLDIELIGEKTWRLTRPLAYQSDLVGRVVVPAGFQTDLATVPRIPFVYLAWGDRAHREAVIHDFLYCIDCPVPITYEQANRVFLEAMESRGVSWHIRYPMYWGVCLGGWAFWRKKSIGWNPERSSDAGEWNKEIGN